MRATILLAAAWLIRPAAAAPPVFDHLIDDTNQITAAKGLVPLPDGDSVVFGFVVSKGRLKDDRPRLVRVGPDGTIRWQRDYPAVHYAYIGAATGAADGSVEFIARQNARRLRPTWMRVGPDGAPLARAEVGDPGCVPSGIASVKGGSILIGYCTVKGKIRPWMEGIDPQGVRRWRHDFDETRRDLRAITATPARDGAVVVGWEHGGKANHNDALVLRVSAAGKILGSATHGGPGVQSFQTVTFQGRTLVAGGGQGPPKTMSPWVVGLDARGKRVRWRWIPDASKMGATTVVTPRKGGVLVGGFDADYGYATNGAAWMAALDARGRLKWKAAFGGKQRGAVMGLRATKAGIVAAGRHESRKSRLSGMWIFGVGPDGAPAGPRSARGAAK